MLAGLFLREEATGSVYILPLTIKM